MRDKIKRIMIDWVNYNKLPDHCEFVPGSGLFTITNTEDPYSNWKVTGSSMPNYNKVNYIIYNKYYPHDIKEKGVLEIGTYNKINLLKKLCHAL